MGACNWSSITRIPGKDSFTSALIWALEDFAVAGVPFTTTQLQMKIGQEAPLFPRDQFPILTPRGDRIASTRRLRLGINGNNATPKVNDMGEESTDVKEIIDLRVCFPKHPENSDIEALSNALKDLIETERITAQGIQWLGLRPNPTAESLAHNKILHHVTYHWQQRVLQHKKSGSLSGPLPVIRTTVELNDPPPTLSPSSVCGSEIATSTHLVPENFPRPATPPTPTIVVESFSDDESTQERARIVSSRSKNIATSEWDTENDRRDLCATDIHRRPKYGYFFS